MKFSIQQSDELQVKIFLDFDGVLVDNALRLYTLYSDLMSEFDRQPLPMESYWILKRERISEQDILKKSGLEDAALTELYFKKRAELIESRHYLQLNTVVNGCFEFLEFLRKQGETILITTRHNRENLFWEIDEKKLSPYFPKVLCGSDTSIPPAEIKIKMVEKEGFPNGSKGMIIGDTEAEILCGQKVGLFTVALTTGIRNRNYLMHMKPDMICDTVYQIAESWDSIMERIGKA
jgi:phosphoglycolate phosphatase-like HAD superfamily hydrolase